jgi:nicotinamide mononucleotide adenylyltransferase
MKKYALYIGRWQTWHEGHRWLINQQLEKGKNVWIAIRDVEEDDNNPYKPYQVMMELHKQLGKEIAEGRVMISIIPDIESFNYGRDVGYEVIEHQPPQEIREISGTKIRKNGIL